MPTINTSFAFFGSSRLSVIVLDDLFGRGLIPTFVVTTPPKLVGRKQILTENIVKQWAKAKNIPVLDPTTFDQESIEKIVAENHNPDGREKCPVFLVASYGKIIPKAIIDIPSKKTLNIHPSLLPKYRGPSPLPTAMLDDTKNTGVTIMRMDEEMDHGPIVAEKNVTVNEWPIYEDFEEMMAHEGAELFANILGEWVGGNIKEREQEHVAATYTKKITKEDGLIGIHKGGTENSGANIILEGDPYLNFRKIQAYHEWPQAYFFIKRDEKHRLAGSPVEPRDLRVKITEATFENGALKIKKVIPEGSKEMFYEDFLRGYCKF